MYAVSVGCTDKRATRSTPRPPPSPRGTRPSVRPFKICLSSKPKTQNPTTASQASGRCVERQAVQRSSSSAVNEKQCNTGVLLFARRDRQPPLPVGAPLAARAQSGLGCPRTRGAPLPAIRPQRPRGSSYAIQPPLCFDGRTNAYAVEVQLGINEIRIQTSPPLRLASCVRYAKKPLFRSGYEARLAPVNVNVGSIPNTVSEHGDITVKWSGCEGNKWGGRRHGIHVGNFLTSFLRKHKVIYPRVVPT
ncbi:hypothetical protein C8R44DRAFT_724291 [Mycena epipterygia]|nr:hypothetical protein C8R44DRAFT_724291 [Mycena epipterygia]